MNPGIWNTHTGFLPGDRKRAVVGPELAGAERWELWSCWPRPHPRRVAEGPVAWAEYPWGRYGTCDFSSFREPGYHQVRVPERDRRGVPFSIGEGVHGKTLEMAFRFFARKRCGVAVPGYHGPCHLDDAVRRDDGAAVEATGGWHDAGDLRKWGSSGLKTVFDLLELEERLRPGWRDGGAPWGDVLDEARWENDYLRKLQDPASGLIWHDVAGGVNGDNSDNRWTDNVRRSGDERHLNPLHRPEMQWQFVAVQRRLARLFRPHDPDYAAACAAAGARCAAALAPGGAGGALAGADGRGRAIPEVLVQAWACLAALEAHADGGGGAAREAAGVAAGAILACQEDGSGVGGSGVRGWFWTDPGRTAFFRWWMTPAIPVTALAAFAERFPEDARAAAARAGCRRYLDGYALPLAERSPFGLVPFGLYRHPPVDGAVRHPLGEGIGYRFFTWTEGSSAEAAPAEKERFEHGGTSHLLSHADALAAVWRLTGREEARDLALRQVEWVMGANPEAACLMTGGGLRTPYPHSYFEGLQPGGILNGFIGGHADRPYLHQELDPAHWQTNEYWIPHNGHYCSIFARLLEGRGGVA